ncbi:MAG: aminotransferase class I/II-fold pyridoxal phosphate-dependent enzyme, partial [Promethearchaeota archaeon]
MTDLFKRIHNFKEAKLVQKMGLYPYFLPSSTAIGPRTTINGIEEIMLGSNNYLGLSCHPEMKQAAKDAIDQYGTGCTGSRLLNGTLDIHNTMEENLAKFFGTEATITISTGYQTNLGAISALTQKGDYVISDELNHASIVDACRLSRSDTTVFKHNDPADLGEVLRKLPKKAGKLVVTEGIFSMEGDIAPIDELTKVAHENDARIMVDDAHAVGVLGNHGEGSPGHFNCKEEVDFLVGTFSKSFASIGGYVAATEETIHFLRHHARSFIFSASIPPASVASITKATELITKGDDLRKQVQRNAKRFKEGLSDVGYNTGFSKTPIIPVIIGKQLKLFKLWKKLLAAGVYTNPVRAPAVPEGRELLRTSVMA